MAAHEEPKKKVFDCKMCEKTYVSRSAFNKHLREHSGAFKPSVCEICGKTVRYLVAHLEVHAGEKNFVCNVCGKAFLRGDFLTAHKRVHTKDKPFKCEVCGLAYTQKTPLTVHMRRKHTGEKPYKCKVCTKGFVTNALLKKHICNI